MAAAVVMSAGCSSGRHAAGPATTVPPGAITVDRWAPPALTGPPSLANFCAALTAIYRHMADLPHVASARVSEDYLSDYATYAPRLVGEAPPDIHGPAATYVGAVAGYLHQLVQAGLDMNHLPRGALAPLASEPVNAAYRSLSGYSTTRCHYTIGGTTGG